MKTLVLSTFSMGKTGHKIADALGADYASKVPKHYAEYDRLIRWGSSNGALADGGVAIVLNRATSIAKMANRLSMFQHLHAHDIPTLDILEDWVGRDTHGMWGKDIKMSDQIAVEQWNADFEVRLHIVHGMCVRTQIKRLKYMSINVPLREWHVRNRKNGWHLYVLSNDEAFRLGINKEVLRNVAKRVMDTANLDFGVVDFLVRCEPGGDYDGQVTDFEHRVLEVNTAPGLEDSLLTIYAEALNA